MGSKYTIAFIVFLIAAIVFGVFIGVLITDAVTVHNKEIDNWVDSGVMEYENKRYRLELIEEHGWHKIEKFGFNKDEYKND